MIGMLLSGLGLLLAVVGGIWLLVLAFKKSLVWGLASFFIGPVLLVFAIMHWEVSKKPFLIWLAGFVLIIIGTVIGGASAIQMPAAG